MVRVFSHIALILATTTVAADERARPMQPTQLDATQFAPPVYRQQSPADSPANSPPDAPGSEGDRGIPIEPESEKAKPKASAPLTDDPIFTVMMSLAVVIVCFFVVIWLSKRGAPSAIEGGSQGVVEIFAGPTISPKQQLRVIRFGARLLLVSVSVNESRTLAEISDAAEVQRILELCQAPQSGSAAGWWNQLLNQSPPTPTRSGVSAEA